MGLTKEQRITVRSNETILRMAYENIKKVAGCYQYIIKDKDKVGVIQVYPEIKQIIPMEYDKVQTIFSHYIGENEVITINKTYGEVEVNTLYTVYNRSGDVMLDNIAVDDILFKDARTYSITSKQGRYKIADEIEINRIKHNLMTTHKISADDMLENKTELKIMKLTYTNLDAPEIIIPKVSMLICKEGQPIRIDKKVWLRSTQVLGEYLIGLVSSPKRAIAKDIYTYIPKEFRTVEENKTIKDEKYPKIWVKCGAKLRDGSIGEAHEMFNGFFDAQGELHDSFFYLYKKVKRPANLSEPWICTIDSGRKILTNNIGIPLEGEITEGRRSLLASWKREDGKIVLDL